MSVFMLNNFPYDCPFNEKGPFISIYLTTHHHPSESKKDRIVFKKLINQAKDKLVADYNNIEIESFLEPLYQLEQESPFWSFNHAGLAVFLKEKNCFIYRLPLEINSSVSYGDKINFKPLIRMFQNVVHYHVLALNRDFFKLYEVIGKSIEEIHLDPSIMIKAKDVIGDQRTESYNSIGGLSTSGMQAATHGHGGKKDDIDIDTEKYLRYVEQTVNSQVTLHKKIPIVLVSLQKTNILYRKLNKNKHLFEKGIIKSPDSMTDQEILDETYILVEDYFKEELRRLTDNARRSIELGKASEDIHQIVKAIKTNQIETMYLLDDRKLYGYVDWENQTVEVNNKSELDILEELAEKTILHGHQVYIVDKEWLKVGSGILAQFR
jgi:hypothetical protein